MYLFLALLALVIVLPYVLRAMAKNSRTPRSRLPQRRAQTGADLPLIDLGDSAHDAGHDCGPSHGGADTGCDAGHH